MESETRKCAYIGCVKEFIPHDKRQIYCCVQCKERARSQRGYFRNRKTPTKELQFHALRCNRTNCLMYKEKMGNHCDGLVDVYRDEMKCPFFKEKL